MGVAVYVANVTFIKVVDKGSVQAFVAKAVNSSFNV